jgi:pectinesterase
MPAFCLWFISLFVHWSIRQTMRNVFALLLLFFVVELQAQKPAGWVVAADGTGNYRTVQAALNAVPEGNSKPVTIHVKKGIYQEVIIVDATKNFVSLVGDDATNTIISFNNHAGTRMPNGDTLNTWTCATAFVYGNDFSARNISFRNDAGFTAGQAVAVRVEGNRASFRKCSFTGFQDVLFLSGSGVKHYFRDCYIEGTTDFIFGAATAVFANCHIHSKKNSHVTAASTNSIIPFGFVFFDCRLTADSTINKVSLGRPWSPTASVTYLRCWLGSHIVPEGWNNWKNPANEATARFAEYKSAGPGASPATRAPWTRQLTDEQAAKYTIPAILGTWDPESDIR